MKDALILTVLLCQLNLMLSVTEFSTLDHIISKTPPNEQVLAAQELITRVVGQRAGQFQAVVKSNLGPKYRDTFNLISTSNHVKITGTTGVAVAMGLYYYLTNHCRCQYTWAGQQMDIPKTLPVIKSPGITVTTNDRFRYYQNVCTVSYSFVWYKWSDWEQQIDWMALRGINLPLAFTGQEAILQKVYMKMGLNSSDLLKYFGGPAFMAWTRMGNMHGWGGPMPQSWVDIQLMLQRAILKRMRSLGMVPVLPGFAGHVPGSFIKVFPKANVSHLPDWGHFNSSYCCNLLLDFNDPLFKKIGQAVVEEAYPLYMMETLGLRMRPEGCCLSDYFDSMALNEITDLSAYLEDQETFMYNSSGKPTESSTFTYITDLSEDFISQDTMATRKCSQATSNADTMYANSSLDLIIDRTCDFVASANSSLTLSDSADNSSCNDTQCVPECSVLTREVVGCEDPDFSGISQLEDTQPTVCPASPSSETSTLSLCKNKESTKPLASSTMVGQFLQHSQSSDSIPEPCASSTMTGEVNHSKPCKFQCTSDLRSIYTWSIYDKSQDTVFDESYVNGHYRIPEIPNTKVLTSSPLPSSCRLYKCDTNKHVMPKEFCRPPLIDSLSVIESSDCLRDGHVDVESLYDENIPVKSNCLPRTSTKVYLCPVENFHLVPSSSDDSGEDIVQERPEPDLPQPKSSKIFKFPKPTTQLKKLFTFRKSKGKNSDKTEPKKYITETQVKQTDNKNSQDVVEVRDKKAMIKKMKSFSASVNKLDGSSVQVLALL